MGAAAASPRRTAAAAAAAVAILRRASTCRCRLCVAACLRTGALLRVPPVVGADSIHVHCNSFPTRGGDTQAKATKCGRGVCARSETTLDAPNSCRYGAASPPFRHPFGLFVTNRNTDRNRPALNFFGQMRAKAGLRSPRNSRARKFDLPNTLRRTDDHVSCAQGRIARLRTEHSSTWRQRFVAIWLICNW